jgi:hypothetical protein
MYATVLPIVLLLAGDTGADDLARKALEKINAYRQAAGLKPVVLDPKLSKGCLAHARYIVKHFDPAKAASFNPHVEDPHLEGYTEEGKKTARQAEIQAYFGKRDPAAAVDSFMTGLFHRIGMIRPDLERVGFAHVHSKGNWGIVVLNAKGGRNPRSANAGKVVVYPADQQTNVPRAFSEKEIPNPIPAEGRGQSAGFPITITFPEKVKVTRATAVLKEADGKVVPVWFSSPEKPASRPELQFNTVCLIAKAQLQPKTKYQVTVTARVDGKPWSRTWTFTTK